LAQLSVMDRETQNKPAEYTNIQPMLVKEFTFQLDCVYKKCCKKYKKGKRCGSCPKG
jgi:hypothetical protein